MSGETKPLYVVSIFEPDESGKLGWRALLSTRDEAKAKALYASLVADEGVRAEIEVIKPGKR